MRYVVVSGGVLSGLGKGVTASSIGVLLRSRGMRVTAVKIDPYLNSDAGTMSPFEHGEVFVLDDGGEVDLDLGNYERFLDVTLAKDNNLTTGKVYSGVIEAERRGDYLGKTVQVVPHVTDFIQDWIERIAANPADDSGKSPDICIIELGGTIGDIESAPFVEALRQFQFRVGKENIAFVHVSLVPVVGPVGEQKTKPTQHTVRDLRALGILPDALVCRSKRPLEDDVRAKLSAFCHVTQNAVMSAHDVSNIYHVPLILDEQGLTSVLCDRLGIADAVNEKIFADWEKLAERADRVEGIVRIGMVGKYTGLTDSYLSIIKALLHATIEVGHKLEVEWIEASYLEDENNSEEHASAWERLHSVDGILVPGGFGDRGIEGKILAAGYARKKKIPYLGICLGMQVAVIEFARNVLGFEGANSTEFESDTPHPVVVFMPEVDKKKMGGTMRLGLKKTLIKDITSLAGKLYQSSEVLERHRHRYEVQPNLIEIIESNGLRFSGRDESGLRMEIAELDGHPFFMGTQFHPEFKSRPQRPSPPFVGFIGAASKFRHIKK